MWPNTHMCFVTLTCVCVYACEGVAARRLGKCSDKPIFGGTGSGWRRSPLTDSSQADGCSSHSSSSLTLTRALPWVGPSTFLDLHKTMVHAERDLFRVDEVFDTQALIRIGSGRVGSGQVGTGQVGSGRVRSGRVGSGRVGSGRVGSGRVGSGRVRSGQVGSGWVGLGWVGPGWAKLGQVGSGWVGSGQAEPGHVGSGRVGLGWVGSAWLGSARLGSARLGSAPPASVSPSWIRWSHAQSDLTLRSA